MTQQATLALDDLPAGGMLAAPVHDENGRLLLPAGTALSSDLIGALRRRGIATVVIRLAPSAGAGGPAVQEAKTPQAQVEERMQRLFRHAAKTGQLNPLLHIVRRYRLGEYA